MTADPPTPRVDVDELPKRLEAAGQEFDYCNGARHYRRCPDNVAYSPVGNTHGCCAYHVWFGSSPALNGSGLGPCPSFTGDYSVKQTRCKLSEWEHANPDARLEAAADRATPKEQP